MRVEAGTYRGPSLRSDHPRLLRSGPAHPSCLFSRIAVHAVLKTSSLGLCFGIYHASLDLAFAFSLSSTCLLSLAFLNWLSWVFEVPLRCHLLLSLSGSALLVPPYTFLAILASLLLGRGHVLGLSALSVREVMVP